MARKKLTDLQVGDRIVLRGRVVGVERGQVSGYGWYNDVEVIGETLVIEDETEEVEIEEADGNPARER